jgi:hypothetical protein
MGGGLMQLVAYGSQDIYLTGNPQITFFKVVYRRHTNFSMESIEQTFNGTSNFGKKVTVTVSRNGDLITKCYLQSTLPQVDAAAQTVTVDSGVTSGSPQPDVVTTVGGVTTTISDDGVDTTTTVTRNVAWIKEVGHFLIKSVEVEIGGQRIDKHYGTWLSVWSSLTTTKGHEDGYKNMIGDVASLTTFSSSTGQYDLYIPLQFWFCRHTGLALPLIALQYHEVKFSIEFETFANLQKDKTTPASTPSLGDTSMYVDYIYLDTDERRRFAQISHEYLIEQLQFTGDESLSGTNNKIKLNFNHPVKELIWVVQSTNTSGNNYTDSMDGGINPTSSAKLQLNGHDRFSTRKGRYFNEVQPYQYHKNVPATGINVYSFALKPEEQQPSGSANMSRIDNATLQLTLTSDASSLENPIVKVFATNYNVLRIMSGMGGLAYSN